MCNGYSHTNLHADYVTLYLYTRESVEVLDFDIVPLSDNMTHFHFIYVIQIWSHFWSNALVVFDRKRCDCNWNKMQGILKKRSQFRKKQMYAFIYCEI